MFPRTTRVALWVIGICLPVALIVPSVPLRQVAAGGTVAGILILVVIFAFELFRADPSWVHGNKDQAESRIHRTCPSPTEDWVRKNCTSSDCSGCPYDPNRDTDDDGLTDDLVDATAAGLIDWTGDNERVD
jgi:hypothetical protein